jgi:hypothetical protein
MKKMYCTLDTETFGGASNPKGVYNLGGRIHDRKGNIVATFNYLICEHYEEIEKDSYAKDNFYRYLEMIDDGSITMIATEDEAIAAVDALCNFYNVDYMMAYNSAFDFSKTKCRQLIEEREFIDIYLMALQTITHLKKYANFCRENNLKSRSGKSCATSAESLYAYITNNAKYSEEHTALEDSKIEMEIFLACLKTHKRFTKNLHQHDCKDNKCFPAWKN